MHPKNIEIASFDYELPDNRIAYFPLKKRDQSKLLVYKDGNLIDDYYHHIASHIPAASLVIFNNTRVIEARIIFQKATGGVIEIFCLEPADKNIPLEIALSSTGSIKWKCMVGGASKWKKGIILEKRISLEKEEIILHATYLSQEPGTFIIEFKWTPVHFGFLEILHGVGAIPLPPYIKREVDSNDKIRYQTIYARNAGSVAAPTAGLHFTENILDGFKNKNIDCQYLTLHVGAGTFKPVKAQTLELHEMHAESIEISQSLIESILSKFGKHPIIAVGTTSLRSVESLYWLGCKIIADTQTKDMSIKQWDPYQETQTDIPVEASLTALLDFLKENNQEKIVADTQIIIAPGYRLKIVDALVTNFHQPRSTLLLIIAALTGENWKEIYTHALTNQYRFLSYGDGSLLWAKK